MSHRSISVMVNGRQVQHEVEDRMLLSDFLRHELKLTGTHVGCEHGVCGACTVQVNGHAMRSCLMFAVQVDGCSVRTVEALSDELHGELHPLQHTFHTEHGLQCGFCTAGFLMSIEPMLGSISTMTDKELREAISGNICRCTGYQGIVRAARLAAQQFDEAGALPTVRASDE